jgi:hypothetical protein
MPGVRNERIAQRAARAVYGSIVALAVILVLDEGGAEADEVIAAVIGSVIAATLAEQYAEYIAHVIRERRHLTRAEIAEQARDGAAGTLAALVTVLPFVAVEFDLIEVGTAYDIAAWLGLGVIGGYSLLANREAGLSGARNMVVTGVALAIGASLIAIKAITH